MSGVDLYGRDKSHEQQRQADQEEHSQRQASAKVVVAGDSHSEEADDACDKRCNRTEQKTGCYRDDDNRGGRDREARQPAANVTCQRQVDRAALSFAGGTRSGCEPHVPGMYRQKQQSHRRDNQQRLGAVFPRSAQCNESGHRQKCQRT